VKHGTKSCPQKYLDEEEKELADFLKKSAEMSFGKARREVLIIAETYTKHKGVVINDNNTTQVWWRSFRNRQVNLSLGRGNNTAPVCEDVVN